MENLLNLNTYKKYLNLINEELIVIPNESLLSNLRAIKSAYKAKPYMEDGETHKVVFNAKKIQITSRGSLRRVAIDGTLASCANTGLSDGLVCETCGKT